MKTAAEITEKIFDEMYYRLAAHKIATAINSTFDETGVNAETIKRLQEERQSIFVLRMNMLEIAAIKILKGEY